MQKPNYASLIKIGEEEVTNPPDWLIPGASIQSKDYGTGKVIAVVGSQLIASFTALKEPVSFAWAAAVENKSLTTRPEDTTLPPGIDLPAISHRLFAQLAGELTDNLVAAITKEPHTGKLYLLPCDLQG